MTHVSQPPPPIVPRTESAVYAFNTDSMQGIGLAIDLLNAGATVYRATQRLHFGGRRFDSGAALVTGSTSRSPTSRRRRGPRDTPVYGLPRFPVARQAIAKPKIAIWTGGDTISAPTRRTTAPRTATAAATTAGVRFTRSQEKIKIPAAAARRPDVDADQRGRARDPAQGFTAIDHPGPVHHARRGQPGGDADPDVRQQRRALRGATTPTVPPWRATSALTTLNTSAVAPARTICRVRRCTPGSTFDGTFDVDEPGRVGLRQGRLHLPRRHDRGRSRLNAFFDNGTLANGASDGADQLHDRHEERTATSATRSAGPASSTGARRSCDQPFGAGRAFLFASDPFFRAWNESASGTCSTRCCTRRARRSRADPPTATARRPRQAPEARPRRPRPRPRPRPSTCRARTGRGAGPGQGAAEARRQPTVSEPTVAADVSILRLAPRHQGAAQGRGPRQVAQAAHEAACATRRPRTTRHARRQGRPPRARRPSAQATAPATLLRELKQRKVKPLSAQL